MSQRKGGEEIKCNFWRAQPGLLVSPYFADYMLNINYGKMSDEPVPHFPTEMGKFFIFIKIVA